MCVAVVFVEGWGGRVGRDVFYLSCELISVFIISKFPLNVMNWAAGQNKKGVCVLQDC